MRNSTNFKKIETEKLRNSRGNLVGFSEYHQMNPVENIENVNPESVDYVNLNFYREPNYQQQPAFIPMTAATLLAREDFALQSPTICLSSSELFSSFIDGDGIHSDLTASHVNFDAMNLPSNNLNASFSDQIRGTELQSAHSLSNTAGEHQNGNGEYVCTECSRSFTKLVALRSHEVVHSNEKKHQCVYCSKAFARRHDMLRHERTVHAIEKSLTCEFCKNAFQDLDALHIHCIQENHPFPDRSTGNAGGKNSKPKGKLHKKTHSGSHTLTQNQNSMKRMISSNIPVSNFSTQGTPMQIHLGNTSSIPLHNSAGNGLSSKGVNNPMLTSHIPNSLLYNQGTGSSQPLQYQWPNQMMYSGIGIDSATLANAGPNSQLFANLNVNQMQMNTHSMLSPVDPTQNSFPLYQLQTYQNQNQRNSFADYQNTMDSQDLSNMNMAMESQSQRQHPLLPLAINFQNIQKPSEVQYDVHSSTFSTSKSIDTIGGVAPRDTLISPVFHRMTLMEDPFEVVVDGLVIQEERGAENFTPLSVLSRDFDP